MNRFNLKKSLGKIGYNLHNTTEGSDSNKATPSYKSDEEILESNVESLTDGEIERRGYLLELIQKTCSKDRLKNPTITATDRGKLVPGQTMLERLEL